MKKTPLQDYDSPRSGGLIAIKLRELADGSSDEVVAASLVDEADDLLLVSRHGMSLRFTADAEALRPMGRAASGVTGMKFRGDDSLLTMDVVHDDSQVFVMTEQGFAKRTSADEYRVQGRAGMGIKVAKLTEARGDLVGALMVSSGDEVLAIMESGKVMRAAVDEVSLTGRNTQGVTFVRPDKGDRIIAVARNAEVEIEEEVPAAGEQPAAEASAESSEAAEVTEPTAAAEDAESTEPAAETLEN